MAHIEQDSELFTNYVSAQAIPAGQHFTAFADELGALSIISLSSDGVLYLFKQKNGRLENENLGQLCGVSSTIAAYAVVQCSNASLCIVFATRTSSGSQVSFLPMVKVSSLWNPDRSKIITSSLLPEIHALAMSDYVDSTGYPVVVAFYQPIGRTTNQKECSLIEITGQDNNRTAKLTQNWSLPVDVAELKDFAFAKTSLGSGIFVLYQDSSSERKLLFSTYDGSDFSVLTKCPSDVNCLTTFTPGKDLATAVSHLILGGGSIYHLTQKEYLHKDRDGVKITGTVLEGSIKSIQSAVKDDHYSLWFTTTDDAAGYATGAIASTNAQLDVVPLLPKGKGGRLSGTLTTTSIKNGKVAVNTLISVDEHDHLSSLQQDNAKGIWDRYPLMMHTSTKNYPVESYTTRIRVMAGVNRAASHATFKLKCSGRISAIVNGFDTPLEEDGQVLACDATGEATFITATADISTHTMSISEIKDKAGNVIDIKPEDCFVQPSRKAMAKLKGIQDAKTLKAATTRDGKALADLSGLSDSEIQQVGSSIGQLAEHAEKLHRKTNTTTLAVNEHVTAMNLSSVGVVTGEWWQWVTDGVHAAEQWFVDFTGAVATFVVKIAGVVRTFVLDSIKAVGKALTWIWTKVKAGFKALIDYLGFLFEWKDIVDAKNSMSATLSAGLLWGSDQIDHTKVIAEKWFDRLKSDLASIVATDQKKVDSEQHSTAPSDKAKESQSSIGSNFSKYHLTHAGALEKFLPELGPENLALITSTWASMTAIIDQGEKDIRKLTADIGKTFKNMDDSVSLLDVVKIVLTDVAVIFLDIAKGLVSLVLGIIRDVIKWFVANGNKVVQIPIFSALYREISGGHDLTMFDAVCLVAAIPATVISKILVGKALPNISGFIDRKTFTGYINGTIDDTKFRQINQFAGPAFIGSNMICTLMQVLDDATQGALSTMALPSTTIQNDSFTHPQVRMMIFTPPNYAGSQPLGWVNLVSSAVNLLCGSPGYKAYTDTAQEGLDWTRWSIAFGRFCVSATGRVCDFAAGTKKTIEILQAIAQVITVLMYLQKRVTVSDGKSYIMRDLIVAISLINTVSKTGVAITKGGDPLDQAVFEVIFLTSSISYAGLQVANLLAVVNGWIPFGQSSV